MIINYGSKKFNVKVGDRFFVSKYNKYDTMGLYGENATLTKITKLHLVLTLDSGRVLKVNFNLYPIGKASKLDLNVYFGEREFNVLKTYHRELCCLDRL